MQNHRARSGQIHFIQSWHQTGESCCGCQRPRGGNPLPSATRLVLQRPQTVTSLHSHDVFRFFFFSLSFFLFCFLKKEKKKKKKEENRKRNRERAQERPRAGAPSFKGGSWWRCQRRERVGQRPAETQGRGRGGLWDRLFLRFVCV